MIWLFKNSNFNPNTVERNDKQAKMVFASKLHELGKLLLGQAAELAGYSKKRTFMELRACPGVSDTSCLVLFSKNDSITKMDMARSELKLL